MSHGYFPLFIDKEYVKFLQNHQNYVYVHRCI